jgi:hypothetical protein
MARQTACFSIHASAARGDVNIFIGHRHRHRAEQSRNHH